MSFTPGYVELLEKLAVAFSAYRDRTGHLPLPVGGAATAIMTVGLFMSGDLDIIAPNNEAFLEAMAESGFSKEDRIGQMPKGFYHPEHPEYGLELVSGPPFDGRSDPSRLLRPVMRGGHLLVLPSFEDMIADCLAQHAVASLSDDSRLRQALMILMMATDIGDLNLLDLGSVRRKEKQMTFDFYVFVAEADKRKRRLGVDESSAAVDAMRNKGGRRTPAKRAMLARIDARARAAGRTPVRAYY